MNYEGWICARSWANSYGLFMKYYFQVWICHLWLLHRKNIIFESRILIYVLKENIYVNFGIIDLLS